MEAREVKGLEIAAKSKLQQSGDRWFVPSQTGHRGTYYTVKPDPAKPHCSCPDFETRQLRCKHLFAVEYVIQREFTYNAETQTETITETVTVKQTYSKNGLPTTKRRLTKRKSFWNCLLSCARAFKNRIKAWAASGCRSAI